ncbi:MAG: 50S ribosomal protein L6 [Gallionellaceae bacterium]|nr:50S ribosomal protein L6 [Gallionellaceae bacterium]
MSRVAKNPIAVPAGVEVALVAGKITVKGPKGSLTQALNADVAVERQGDVLLCKATNDSQQANAQSGTIRALVANMITGVNQGFERKLTLVGVGYRAQAAGDALNLTLGFSHPVVHKMPSGVKVATPSQTEIIISGSDKQQVGQVAAEIRAYRQPEPYKGKGVRYADEVVILKETKKK